VAKKKASSVRLYLTARAIRDIAEIREYSVEEFGRRSANQYLSTIENTLNLLKSSPSLLRDQPELHSWFKFYRCKKHFLVCDQQASDIYVLTLIHTSMDLPTRLLELEPSLTMEVEVLHRKLQHARKRS
jgi:plasmid stabilization system protein ParE